MYMRPTDSPWQPEDWIRLEGIDDYTAVLESAAAHSTDGAREADRARDDSHARRSHGCASRNRGTGAAERIQS